jgi:hypothetical protein
MRVSKAVPQLRTPGVIAGELGQPLHRILYILRTRPYIVPSARAGRLRLFDLDAVAMIRQALNGVDARRGVDHE